MEALIFLAWILQAIGFAFVGAILNAGVKSFFIALFFGPIVALAYCIAIAKR